MDWIKLAIPLIAVAVWILSNLAKNREEPRRQRTAPPPRPEDGEGPRRRRTPAEVDQFLEEVRRRREAAEAKVKKLEEKPVPIPLSQKVAAESPFPRARAVPPPPPVPTPPPVRSETRRAPTVEPILAKVVPVPEQVVATPIVVPKVTPLPISPQVQQTLALLKNRKSLVTAILLREILEQPLCRRTREIPARRK